MKLSSENINEIIRLLRNGQYVPEKYRFDLFENPKGVELIWRGKTNTLNDISSPLRVLEYSDTRILPDTELDFDSSNLKKAPSNWRNKIIWGDNKTVMPSLCGGSLNDQIKKEGGIKLIYVDPPFDIGIERRMEVNIGESKDPANRKKYKDFAYNDRSGRGKEIFLESMRERITLMHKLLADDGSIYFHCDWRTSALSRLLLDEIFGTERIINENIWSYKTGGLGKRSFARKHDTIFMYSKSAAYHFNTQYYKSWQKKRYNYNSAYPEYFDEDTGRWYHMSVCRDVWDDIYPIGTENKERNGYPTQKPESLLERVIKASSNEGEIVADFFSGSGTTASVAEKLKRKWIISDIGRSAVNLSRKRILDLQASMKLDNISVMPYEILSSFGSRFIESDKSGPGEKLSQSAFFINNNSQLANIISSYDAVKVDNFEFFHAKKGGRYVHVVSLETAADVNYMDNFIRKCLSAGVKDVDVLALGYEPGAVDYIRDISKQNNLNIVVKSIPHILADESSVPVAPLFFFEPASVDFEKHIRDNKISIEIKGYNLSHCEISVSEAEKILGRGQSCVVSDKGIAYKIQKTKSGKILPCEKLTDVWSDWIDYWSVDYNYGQVSNNNYNDDYAENLSDSRLYKNHVFTNHWSSFRTGQNRNIDLKSKFFKCCPGERTVAVMVTDILGKETVTQFPVVF